MPAVFRPRRSLLFMPGSNPRALEKARSLPADGLIIDLEDAVAAEAKGGSPGDCRGGTRRRRLWRARAGAARQSLDTPWGHADLAAGGDIADRRGAAAKVESADRVRLTACRCSTRSGRRSSSPSGACSRRRSAFSKRREIAAASPRLAVLVLGTSDLTKDLHAVATLRPPTADHRARPRDAGCPRPWPRHPRRRPSRPLRRGGLCPRLPAGPQSWASMARR